MRDKLIALSMVSAATVLSLPVDDELTTQEFITLSEGIRNAAYADPAHGWAVPTICIGHTRTARKGMWRSDEQCLDLLEQDVRDTLIGMQHLLGRNARLTEGELIAYTSFVFNLGYPKLMGSTWRKKFLAGDRIGACYELTRWVYSNGKKLRGLQIRRGEERAVCLRDLKHP